MPGCCAVGCRNSRDKGFKLFRLPSEKLNSEKRKIWISRIKRENFKPSAHTVLCEVHFEKDQFESNIPGKLKPNALPTLFSHCPPPKRRKVLVRRDLDGTTNNARTSDDVSSSKSDHSYAKMDPLENNEVLNDPLIEAPDLCNENPFSEDSSQDVLNLRDELEETKSKLLSAQREIKQLQKEKKELISQFSALFTPDQIEFLQHPFGGYFVTWSDETVKKASQLRIACGFNGYHTLLAQGFPLPSARTLRRKLQHISFLNGLIPEVMEMLAMKVQSMSDQEKKVALSLDEMAIQPSLDYDCRSCGVLRLPTVADSANRNSDYLATHALVFIKSNKV